MCTRCFHTQGLGVLLSDLSRFYPVGNATLVVANVLTCNKHSHKPISVTHTLALNTDSTAHLQGDHQS
jgi:hypothetical protein